LSRIRASEHAAGLEAFVPRLEAIDEVEAGAFDVLHAEHSPAKTRGDAPRHAPDHFLAGREVVLADDDLPAIPTPKKVAELLLESSSPCSAAKLSSQGIELRDERLHVVEPLEDLLDDAAEPLGRQLLPELVRLFDESLEIAIGETGAQPAQHRLQPASDVRGLERQTASLDVRLDDGDGVASRPAVLSLLEKTDRGDPRVLRLLDIALEPEKVVSDENVSIGGDVPHDHIREHARSRDAVGAIVDHGDDPRVGVFERVLLVEAETRPVAERAVPLVRRHSVYELDDAVTDPRRRIRLEHAEVRHDAVGHRLEREVLLHSELARELEDEGDVVGVLVVRKALEDVIHDEPSLEPARGLEHCAPRPRCLAEDEKHLVRRRVEIANPRND